MIAPPVFAAEPHEDPYTSPVIFSGTSLFEFYSGNLDFVSVRNQPPIQSNILKSPFSNLPLNIQDSFNNFLASSNALCTEIIALDSGVNAVKDLIQQSRYFEAAPIINQSFENIASGETNLDKLEQATNIGASEFKIADTATPTATNEAYQAVLDRIQSLRNLLELFKMLLSELTGGATSPITDNQLSDQVNQHKLLPTNVTLDIVPAEAFVGDVINVQGMLLSSGNPLGNRQILIMLDGSSKFIQGPIFSNLVLADELNRTTPRTQSALLEAMAENQVTIEGKYYPLVKPSWSLLLRYRPAPKVAMF